MTLGAYGVEGTHRNPVPLEEPKSQSRSINSTITFWQQLIDYRPQRDDLAKTTLDVR